MKPYMVKVTEFTAIKVEGVTLEGGVKRIDVRQMFRTQKNPEWRHTSKGLSLDPDVAFKVLRAINKTLKTPEQDYTEVQK